MNRLPPLRGPHSINALVRQLVSAGVELFKENGVYADYYAVIDCTVLTEK